MVGKHVESYDLRALQSRMLTLNLFRVRGILRLLLAGMCLILGVTLVSSTARPPNDRARAVQEKHLVRLPAPILSVDFMRNSNLAVVALSDGRVRVLDLDTGTTLHEFSFTEPETDQRQKDEGDVEPIRVRFSADAKILAISYLSRIHLYDAGTWSELKSLGVEGEDTMRPLASPRLGSRPSTEKEPDDLNTGTKKWAQRKTAGDGRTRITDFAFAPDGTAIVASYCRVSCYDNPDGIKWKISPGHEPLRLWKVHGGQMVWEQHSDKDQVTERTVLSPDGKILAAVIFQPGHWTLQFRDLVSGEKLSSIAVQPLPHDPPEIAFMPDGRRFLSLWAEPRKMWQLAMFDCTTAQLLSRFDDSSGAQHVAVSPDGTWFAATTWRRPHAFKLWDLQQKKAVATTQPHAAGVQLRTLDEIRFIGSRKIAVSDYSQGILFTYELVPREQLATSLSN